MTDTKRTNRKTLDKSQNLAPDSNMAWNYTRRLALVMFLLTLVFVGGTVAGPGVSWDEPAYRASQVVLQSWWREIREASTWSERWSLFSADQIGYYWQFNRFGHNFHPPMASYGSLCTLTLTGYWLDDISARRMASVLEFAALVGLLCLFWGQYHGPTSGLLAALFLLTMPRVVGDAHVIGTDMPLMFFWVTTALAFWYGQQTRSWQWLFAFSWGCLFLVKFSGVVIGAPLVIWFLFAIIRRGERGHLARWLMWTLVMVLPLLPLAITLLWGASPRPPTGVLGRIARWGMEYGNYLKWSLLAPLVVYIFFLRQQRNLINTTPFAAGITASSRTWSVAWELPWVALAVTPVVCILLNPTWWHDTVPALARYFDLNLRRQGHLPDIGIFYWGQRYLYSLPWHNAWILLAITLPWGALLCGVLGCTRIGMNVLIGKITRFLQRDKPCDPASASHHDLSVYFFLHAITLPCFRMLPTPAHDGVRLFLPTFFFWAALAAWGASGLMECIPRPWTNWRRGAWCAIFLAGPGWASFDWCLIHPYELSYYNVGLARAVDWGFEPTYWYDAVTPRVLADINSRLPAHVAVGLPDPLINPPVFQELQSLGRLRGDVDLELTNVKGFPWYWLLTHSSKATPFTRLLYACQPWYESGTGGVRLFSVVDNRSAAVAWALHGLTVERDRSRSLGPLELYEPAFSADLTTLHQAAELFRAHGNGAAPAPESMLPAVRVWWERLRRPQDALAKVIVQDSEAALRAMEILVERPQDVRRVLAAPGYLRPQHFGGYFTINLPPSANP